MRAICLFGSLNVLSLASAVAAPSNLICRVIDECRSDDGTCQAGDGLTFQMTLAAGEESLRVVTPQLDAVLARKSTDDVAQVFEGELEGSTLSVTLDRAGNFTGIRTSGGGFEHVLRAACKVVAP